MAQQLAIIIPVYNEANGLDELITHLNSACQNIESSHDIVLNYLFVDDGSEDDTFERLKNYDFGSRMTKIIRFSRNFGKEAAISAGIDAAHDMDGAILMDGDMQHPPEMLVQIIELWLETKANSVYAYKQDRVASEGVTKGVLSHLFFWIINKGARFNIRENAGDFRLVDRKFMEALRRLPESERFMKGLYGWVGFSQVGIPFTPTKRDHGLSNFGGIKLLLLTLDALTSFSIMPLRLMAFFGCIIALLSSLYGTYIIIERILFATIASGISSILTLVAFFGGMQMIFLGIVGEYVGKAVIEAKKRPAYLVREEIHLNGRDHDSDSR